MKQKKFQELEPDMRVETLRVHASSIERKAVDVLYTEEEINTMQGRLCVLQTRNCEIEDNISAFVKPLQEEMKDIKAETRFIVREIKAGCKSENVELFLFNVSEKKITEVYNAQGVLVETREFKPAQQATVFDMRDAK